MILPRLRSDLDIMPSPVDDRPGLLIRDPMKYTEAILVVPPPFIRSLACFDGTETDLELRAELTESFGARPELDEIARQFVEALSQAGYLEDEVYARLKEDRQSAFANSPVLKAAHAGSAYPEDIEALRELMGQYLDGKGSTNGGLIGIAAPHISPEGGWQCYRAAYEVLSSDLCDRTFVVLGTSHYGRANKFGLTRKPFETPFGTTGIDDALVAELELQPAALAEDYCHSVEHSIEFQVLFLQAIYGPGVRVLPILCGSFAKSIMGDGEPESDEDVRRFLGKLKEIAEREKSRLFWVLGVDMAHMGVRYGDGFAALADEDGMVLVRERDAQRIERVNASDARGFWDLVRENQDDLKWCGSSPFYTFMKAVPQARGTLRRYQQWNIDGQSVVSFAGISFSALS